MVAVYIEFIKNIIQEKTSRMEFVKDGRIILRMGNFRK